MPKYTTKDICNIALVGHGDSGKTTLSDGFLFLAGANTRLGSVEDGSSIFDWEDEEKHRGNSLNLAIGNCDYNDRHVNILDCPGSPDFSGDAYAGLQSVETAVIAVNAGSGVMVNTRRMWDAATNAGVARFIVVTKMDHENVNFTKVVDGIRSAFGNDCVPVLLPVGTGDDFTGVINVLKPGADIPAEFEDFANEAKERILEADEELLMKYLEEEEITPAELAAAIQPAVADGSLVPILCCAAKKEIGTKEVFDFITAYSPNPEQRGTRTFTKSGSEETLELGPDPSGPVAGQVFKIISDPFVGKLGFVRMHSGSQPGDQQIYLERTGESYRIGGLFSGLGKETTPLDTLIAGDIGVISKVEEMHAGDTITAAGNPVKAKDINFPKPMVSLAIEPKSRKDEGKIGQTVAKFADMDPCFYFERDAQTHELVIYGMSQLHLEVTLAKMAAKPFEVDVETKTPRIAYRETISGNADTSYRHKKQSGGAGQFAEVHIKVEPTVRGEGFTFDNAIVGGSISQQFIPSVEKGIRQVLLEGAVAGYPVVDVKVSLYDGKEHPVDSKDIAFQIAGRNAFREAVKKAKPVLLEPVMELDVTVPSEYMGSINGDLNSRRGRIQGMDSMGDFTTVKAQVPMAEVMNYSTELRSITGGEGSYSLEFSHYDVVPSNIAQGIIANAQLKEDEDA